MRLKRERAITSRSRSRRLRSNDRVAWPGQRRRAGSESGGWACYTRRSIETAVDEFKTGKVSIGTVGPPNGDLAPLAGNLQDLDRTFEAIFHHRRTNRACIWLRTVMSSDRSACGSRGPDRWRPIRSVTTRRSAFRNWDVWATREVTGSLARSARSSHGQRHASFRLPFETKLSSARRRIRRSIRDPP